MGETSASCFSGEKCFPPGFRFHPTDEELVLYYLKRKMCRRRLMLDIISETDVYKWDPEELPGLSKLRNGDRQWFFFSPRDRKYPNGARSNRATRHGYWKATGKDRNIGCNSRPVGVKKTLVFYKGRAPSGERTDWVMHEYTLDEEELKRCPNVKDYYALYKVFKKSGPGPKNGEQYGAPFKEEDWADEEDVNGLVDQEHCVQQVNDSSFVHNTGANGVRHTPSNDFEEPMNRIEEEPLVIPPFAVSYDDALQQLVEAEEDQSTFVDHHSSQQHNGDVGFGLRQVVDSQALEVTSTMGIPESEPSLAEKDVFGDFVEIDDLLGPEPIVQNYAHPVDNFQFDDINGLTEFDFYHDTFMFLREMGPGEQVQSSEPYMGNLENGMVNQFPYSYLNNPSNDVVNYQPQPQSVDAIQGSSQLETLERRSSGSTLTEDNQRGAPPNSGGGGGGEVVGTPDSWFSSALWSFVESIPTSPASASESALVSRAFERMSSFGRVRINALNTTTTTTTTTISTTGTASAGRPRLKWGFLCFSVLGVVCAILWVLMARFIPS